VPAVPAVFVRAVAAVGGSVLRDLVLGLPVALLHVGSLDAIAAAVVVDTGRRWRQPGRCRPGPSRPKLPRSAGVRAAGGTVARTRRDRERPRDERELREAARVLAHLRGLSLEDAAQALEDHAVLVGTSVIEMAREVLPHRPGIRPRVLTRVTDLEQWAATGRGSPGPPASADDIPTQRTDPPRTDEEANPGVMRGARWGTMPVG
jgi:hypothetical protein